MSELLADDCRPRLSPSPSLSTRVSGLTLYLYPSLHDHRNHPSEHHYMERGLVDAGSLDAEVGRGFGEETDHAHSWMRRMTRVDTSMARQTRHERAVVND